MALFHSLSALVHLQYSLGKMHQQSIANPSHSGFGDAQNRFCVFLGQTILTEMFTQVLK